MHPSTWLGQLNQLPGSFHGKKMAPVEAENEPDNELRRLED